MEGGVGSEGTAKLGVIGGGAVCSMRVVGCQDGVAG